MEERAKVPTHLSLPPSPNIFLFFLFFGSSFILG